MHSFPSWWYILLFIPNYYFEDNFAIINTPDLAHVLLVRDWVAANSFCQYSNGKTWFHMYRSRCSHETSSPRSKANHQPWHRKDRCRNPCFLQVWMARRTSFLSRLKRQTTNPRSQGWSHTILSLLSGSIRSYAVISRHVHYRRRNLLSIVDNTL